MLRFLCFSALKLTLLLTFRHQVCKERIRELVDRTTPDEVPTVFDTMINPDPKREHLAPSIQDMADEAFLLLIAGTDTTATTLAMAVYNLLCHSDKLETLKTELRKAMPNREDALDWASLEKLPYLVGNHAVLDMPRY